MGFQMCVIGISYKTPFRRAGHIYNLTVLKSKKICSWIIQYAIQVIYYLLKNSLAVKKCGPVQNGQCEKSHKIKGVAKK